MTIRPAAIPGAEVLVEALGRRTLTDAQGRYVLTDLPAGLRLMLVRAVGYQPLRVMLGLAAGATVHSDVALEPTVVQLEPLEVTALPPRGPRGIGREAFEERRRLGFGRFIDSAELRRNEHHTVPDLLRRFPGVVIRPTGLIGGGIVMSGRYGCPMQIFLDGVPYFRPGHGEVPDLKLLTEVKELEAIEIYRGPAETPAEFGGHTAACGTIVQWTKRAP